MLLGDNVVLMKFKFVELLQKFNFGFHKIIDIQLCLHFTLSQLLFLCLFHFNTPMGME